MGPKYAELPHAQTEWHRAGERFHAPQSTVLALGAAPPVPGAVTEGWDAASPAWCAASAFSLM